MLMTDQSYFKMNIEISFSFFILIITNAANIKDNYTLEIGASEMLGVNFDEDPSNFWEHSVYADPMPTPAPKATDAQRVTGLPGVSINIKWSVRQTKLTVKKKL